MKIVRSILLCTLIFLCLFCSCSLGGADPKKNVTQEEKTEDKTENLDEEDEEENDDETEDDKTENKEDVSKEIPPAPVFLRYKTLPENEIVFEFSVPVSFVSLKLNLDLGFNAIEEGKTVKIKLTENPEPGLQVEADLLVKDDNDNTVSVRISFRIRNNRIPKLQINELRTEYSKPKAEFIEFKIISDGNLGALRVFVISNSKNPQIYEFKPVEVKANEYVVLHLRTFEESCKDEYGEDLNESGGADSCSEARDFWVLGTTKLLRKTDAVYVMDQDDKVLDAVMIAETPSSSWSKDHFTIAAEFLFSKDAWKSPAGKICSPADAVSSSGIKTAMTRSISRYESEENTHTAANWYVTADKGITLGLPNKP
jgi:hypothetical protein